MSQVTITLTDDTEKLIRKCCVALYGDEAASEPLGELLGAFLPDLIQDALDGQTLIASVCSKLEQPTDLGEVPDETTPERLSGEEIHREVEAIASKVTEPDIAMPLEMEEQVPAEEPEEVKPPTLDEILQQPESNNINSKALEWAKGNPLKESALAETLWALPSSLWSMAKVRDLAERTFDMRSGSPTA